MFYTFAENQNSNVPTFSNHLYFTYIIQKNSIMLLWPISEQGTLSPRGRYSWSLFSFSMLREWVKVLILQGEHYWNHMALFLFVLKSHQKRFKTDIMTMPQEITGQSNEYKHKFCKNKNGLLRKSLFSQGSSATHAQITVEHYSIHREILN